MKSAIKEGAIRIGTDDDASIIATGAKDGTVKIWRAGTGKIIKELKGHTGAVTSVAFSAGNRFVYTGSLDETFKRWYLSTGSTEWSAEMSFDMELEDYDFRQDRPE